jgi:hypothetical protein
MIGPFTTDINAKNDVFNKLNFKKYFLNNIQKLYNSKDLSFENLSEEECFIKKKKILMLVELICEMFLENFVNIDIINIIIIDLLHLNNFSIIEDIEYESLYNLIKMIHDNNFNKKINFEEYTVIFNEYINIIKNIIENVELKKRSIFFMNDTIIMLKKLINDNTDNTNTHKKNELNNNDNSKKKLLDILKNVNNMNIKDYIELYKKTNNTDKYDIIYKTIDIFLSQKSINKNIINILNDIKDYENINNVIEKNVENINDIILDIPTANDKLIYLIENTKYQYNNKNNWIQLLKNVDDDSSDSDINDDIGDNNN